MHLVMDLVTRQLGWPEVPDHSKARERIIEALRSNGRADSNVKKLDVPDWEHFGTVDDYWLRTSGVLED